ncbi:MAG TPA: 30S ribosomal protein S15 [Elusimicrobia bacterium]|nr:30S ribosomal protein S15 [Elusimicrobiota bacterium]HBT60922.1 30S ribosomal protein S15 [Elusimicrobiota bacterium]
MITKDNRSETIKKYAKKTGDTGSPEVQIALITERIKSISSHLKANTKDHATHVGLLRLVSQRRRLLDYLKKKDLASYGNVVKQLDLRK